MKIGIDFDNTIANYDNAFKSVAIENKLVPKEWHGTKSSLKKKIIEKHSIIEWQKLQGQVYGRFINKAKLFNGLKRFLVRCSIEKHEVYIISHKTQYGHFDSMNINLRSAALNWMKNQQFFNKDFINIDAKKIFFLNTQKKKINKIKNLNLDLMIDDLPEIFENKITKNITTILFRNKSNKTCIVDFKFKSWWEIENFALGIPRNSTIASLADLLLSNEKIVHFKKINESGNSSVYQLETDFKNKYALKQYPSPFLDKKKRLATEIMATKLLLKTGLSPVPHKWDKDLNIAIFHWIEGSHINNIIDNHFYKLCEFTKILWMMSSNLNLKVPYAAESCRSYIDLCNQIDKRLNQLLLIENLKLNNFLVEEFQPLLNKTKKFSLENWPANNINRDLDRKFLILSPSDFGFHNALQLTNSDIKFIDFEYFGLDDPVKLISDILWHPAMKITQKQKSLCTKLLLNIFQEDNFIKKRLNAAFSLYGLRWALIILNEFLPKKWLIRVHANEDKNSKKEILFLKQLKKASTICKEITANNMEFKYD